MPFIGLMSGTSTDAVDAALVDFDGERVSRIRFEAYPIEPALRARIRALDGNAALERVAELDVELGRLFAKAVNRLLRSTGVARTDVRAVGSHGQTILHRPRCAEPSSLQIGDPNIIARDTGITTVADFRRMDMAAGGEGAPLAPAFHAAQFRSASMDRAVLNIGGIANLSVLPRDATQPVRGFDSGPGNGLMDDWSRRHIGQEFDTDGRWAASGRPLEALLTALLADPYFSKAPPKSSGREYFNLQWLGNMLQRVSPDASHADVQATLAELSARTIADALQRFAPGTRQLLVCGGGVHNVFLVQRIAALIGEVELTSTAAHGVDPDCVEAVTFAWLAKQRVEGQPLDLSGITGAKGKVLLGGVYEPVKA